MAEIEKIEVHKSPTMWINKTSFKCERTGSKLKVKGTFTLQMLDSTADSKFGFNYAIRGKYSGGQAQEVKIKPNFVHGGKTTQDFAVDFEFDAQAAGSLQLFACCYGTANDDGCTIDTSYSEFEFYKEDFKAAMENASIILEDWKPISRHDSGNAWFTWNEVSNQSSTTSQIINGNGNNSNNTGDSSGRRDYKPSDYNNVGEASSYGIEVKRKNDIPSEASDSVTVYTYTFPKLDKITYPINKVTSTNLKSNPKHLNDDNIINADRDFTANWGGNYCVNDGKTTTRASGNKSKTTSDKHNLKVYLNGKEIHSSITGGTNFTSFTSISSSKLKECVPYNSKYDRNGQTVQLKVVKSHHDDGSIPSAEQVRDLTVRYTPVVAPVWPVAPETGFRLNSSTGIILKHNSVIEKDKDTKIYVNWVYPCTDEHQLGIINGYRIRIWSGVNSSTCKEYDVPSTSYSESYLIPSMDIKYGTNNRIEIAAYYKHSDGTKHYGPELVDKFITAVSKLQPPSILYPVNGSEWINRNYRVLFILPQDNDYEDYDSTIKDNYEYAGVEININGIVLSFAGEPSIFSLVTLSHMAKLAINPSLAANYPSSTSYTYKVRVKKKYGYDNADLTVANPWSEWSKSMTVKVVPDTFSVVKGEYIMAAHYNTLVSLTTRINKCYPLFNNTTKSVKVGDYIMGDDFYLPYNDITACFNAVNNWGKYDTTRNKVKFNEGKDLPAFKSKQGEYITALEDDTIVPGRNYIWKMHSMANLLK